MSYWNDYGYYAPSSPRKVKGGIKAQSKGGAFGQSWWAQRWIDVLEDFNIGERLSRGRSYARRGQVLSIEIEKGKINAEVQGSRRRPYEVIISVKEISHTEWKKLGRALSGKPIFAAKLISGKMPENIEEVFEEFKLSLFPKKLGDLQSKCSCPDWSNPCKHVAAVYYLLGEEFDRDPFLIFRLRGIEREEFIAWLGGESTQPLPTASKKPPLMTPNPPEDTSPPPEPLPVEPSLFWGENIHSSEPAEERALVPTVSAAFPKRLGKFPFWRGEENFLVTMETLYQRASPLGLELFLGSFKKKSRIY